MKKTTITFIFSALLIFSQGISAKEKGYEYMGRGMMGQGYMGAGMGPGMMGAGGMCPYSSMENVKTNITETSDGVTVTYTAKDKKDVARLQKMAKMQKLSQELNEEEEQTKTK